MNELFVLVFLRHGCAIGGIQLTEITLLLVVCYL